MQAGRASLHAPTVPPSESPAPVTDDSAADPRPALPRGEESAMLAPTQLPPAAAHATPATESSAEADAELDDGVSLAAAAPIENGPVDEPLQRRSPAAVPEAESSMEETGIGTGGEAPSPANGILTPQLEEEAGTAVADAEPANPDAASASEKPSGADEAPAVAVEQREVAWYKSTAAATVDQAQQDK